MASVVNIQLTVDESGAVAAFRNTDASLKQNVATVALLDAEVKRLSESWNLLGTQGAAAGAKTAAGANQAAAGMDKLRNKSALARFELQELGLRAPRYFASAIASSEMLLGVMQALSGVFLGFAAVSLFATAIKGASDFYHNTLDMNAAFKQYNAEVEKHRDEEFTNTRSIETARDRLRELNSEAERWNDEASKAEQHDAFDWADWMNERSARKNEAAVRGQIDKLSPVVQNEDDHQKTLRAIEVKHANDWNLSERARAKAEEDKQKQINAENRTYANRVDAQAGRPVPKDAGAEEESQKNLIAHGETASKLAEIDKQGADKRKQQLDEVSRLQNEASNAGVRGDRLAAQQREQAYADFVRKYGENTTARAAIDSKYFANLRREEEDAQRATNKLVESSHAAGLTGLAHSDAEYQAKYNDTLQAATSSGKISEMRQLPQRLGALSSEHDRTSTEEEDAYYHHLNELVDGWNSHQEQGFAHIQQETKNHVAELRAEYDKLFGGLAANDPRRAQGTAALSSAIDKTNADAGRQTSDLTEKNLNETLKLEDEARRRSLPIEQQKTQELYDQYRERVRGYQQSLKDQLISNEDYNRRVAAAGADLNGELATQAKEQRDKLAGQLDGLFKSPQKYFKELGTHMMAQSGAAILQQMQKHLPGQLAQGGAPETTTGMGGGVLGSLLGGNWLRGKHSQAPVMGMPEHSSTGMFSISTATISIQSANISGGATSSPAVHGAMFDTLSDTSGVSASSSDASGITGPGSSPSLISGISGASATGGSARGGSGVLGNVSSGLALYNQVKSTFSHTAAPSMTASPNGAFKPTQASVDGDYSSSDSTKLPEPSMTSSPNGAFKPTQASVDGDYSSSDSTKLPDSGGGITAAQAQGMFQGGMGLYGAAMSTGGVGGALGGAMSGMQLGMAAGATGAAVGAIGGAILGAFGFGGRMQAQNYWLKQGKPHMDQTDQAFATGAMAYLDAYNDMNSLEVEAQRTTSKMGPSAGAYYGDTIKPALEREKRMFTQEERGGRGNVTMSAAQYHTGGTVDDFYGLATSSDEGFIHARRGEIVVQPQAARAHAPLLSAINAGASSEQVARSYQSTMQSTASRQSGSGDRTVNMTFASHDSKSTARLFMENAHHIRAALNSDYGEYSGGSDASN